MPNKYIVRFADQEWAQLETRVRVRPVPLLVAMGAGPTLARRFSR